MVLGAPSGTATAKQCVNVPADGTAYVARVRAREVIALGTVTGSVGVELFSGSDCSATHLIGLFSSDATVSTSWTKLVLAGGAGSVGAHSVEFAGVLAVQHVLLSRCRPRIPPGPPPPSSPRTTKSASSAATATHFREAPPGQQAEGGRGGVVRMEGAPPAHRTPCPPRTSSRSAGSFSSRRCTTWRWRCRRIGRRASWSRSCCSGSAR